MFPKKIRQKDGLDQAIDDVLLEMQQNIRDPEQYSTMVDQLSKLYALKENERNRRVSPDTMAIVCGNLLGVLVIVGYEKTGVVTSKALNLLLKLR